MTTICWFRRDLRLDDNPAWTGATRSGAPVAPVYVLEPRLLDASGPHRRSFLLASVGALRAELRELGLDLLVVDGPATRAIPALVRELGATAVHVNAEVSRWGRDRDDAVAEGIGVPLQAWWGVLTQPPGTVLTGKGTLSRVFTPFWKRWDQTPIEPVAAPATTTLADLPAGTAIPDHDEPPMAAGTSAAHDRLRRFVDRVDHYHDRRDLPAIEGTSGLSADLHLGTLGPREVIDTVGTASAGRDAFIRQLAWRDWYAHLLFENPGMPRAAIRPEYDRIRWRHDPEALDAWRDGRTGYPLVDAAMRQLAATGWMHNRTRMVAGSFLVKHLLIDWREGERWFRHLLIDGDVAQNAGNWQWVAGTGPDAAPYFRVFNPTAQSRKFDAGGEYIRRWVPELAGLDDASIHEPAAAGPLDLAAAGVVLGDTYPAPIVDHAESRERCLATYKAALA